jgi:hypothetical protein
MVVSPLSLKGIYLPSDVTKGAALSPSIPRPAPPRSRAPYGSELLDYRDGANRNFH